MSEKYNEDQKFEQIKLKDEILEDMEFVDCEFVDCALENCKLIRCTFSNCKFYKCKSVNLQTEYSQIKNAEFSECHLVGLHWSELAPVGKFAEPISKIEDCCLKYNTFTEMDFRKFDFSGSEVSGSTFSDCGLVESNFKQCGLDGTEFLRCDIRKADFREASGYQIDIMSNKMKGARFSFPEVVSLLNVLEIKID